MDAHVTAPTRCPGIAAVVPCYNAGTRLLPVLQHLLKVVDTVWVVDDGSTDGAAENLQSLPVQVLAFPKNRGKGYALLEGFRAALAVETVKAVVVVDADGQHDPAEIPRLVDALRDHDADLVIGARSFQEGRVPWRSRFGNRLTALIACVLLRRHIPDTQSGFRLHRRAFLEAVTTSIPGGRYETEMEILVKAVREHWKIVNVPIRTIYETGNPSSHFGPVRDSVRIYLRLLRVIFLSRRPRRQDV
jgi:glycosyltransferase involved in cell wall biosynthesis